MSPEITEIISAMEFAAQHGLRRYVNDDGSSRLVLCRGGLPAPALAASTHAADAEQKGAASLTAHQANLDIRSVASHVPGICHLSPDPASPPFVTEGSRIEEGQTVCVIEAMKVMTAIAAPCSGVVARIHIASGSSVAVGDLVMDIRT